VSFIFLFFLLTYGAIHYYVFCKFKAAFHPSLPVSAGFIVVLAFMVIAPVMVPVVERYCGHFFARVFAYLSYGWIGFVFFIFCLSLLFDLHRLLMNGASRLLNDNLQIFIPNLRQSFLFSILLSSIIFVYGLFEAENIRVEKIVLKSDKISESVGKIRIVQISDLHIGTIMSEARLERVIAKIKEANPDILVSTGDLVDGQGDSLFNQYGAFQDIMPPFGKFAVTGNHEFYAGIDRAIDFTRRAGFTVLREEGVTAGGMINIAGIDDLAVRHSTSSGNVSFRKMLRTLPPDKFTLFLYHRPLVEEESLGAFDLQLSGHTHKGQIFPFSIITGLFFPMQAGYFPLPAHSSIYVSRGTGTWGPPIRFLSPPEITVIDLLRKM
jgi:uncharacterized protein